MKTKEDCKRILLKKIKAMVRKLDHCFTMKPDGNFEVNYYGKKAIGRIAVNLF
jgi:hypothetical protein